MIVEPTLPTMTEVQKGAMAADRLALTRPPGGQNAQHCVPVRGAVQSVSCQDLPAGQRRVPVAPT